MLTTTRVSAILTRDGKLMLVKCRGIEDYVLPGGMVECGESDLEALKRELREELSITLSEAEFVGEYRGLSYPSNTGQRHKVVARAYLVGYEGDPEPDQDEVVEMAWLTRPELETGRHPLSPILGTGILPDLKLQRRF